MNGPRLVQQNLANATPELEVEHTEHYSAR